MSEKTKEKLIAAALQCLGEKGYANCSVKQIAAMAGVNHGLVHHYFGSKEGLLVEALKQLADDVASEIIQGNREGFTERYENKFLGDSQRMRLIAEALLMARDVPAIREVITKIMQSRRKLFVKAFNLKDELDSVLLFGALYGLGQQFQVDPNLPVKPALDKLIRLLMADSNVVPEHRGDKPEKD